MDALSFLSAIHSFFPDVISPSNNLFNYIPNLKPLILGVNVFGTNTKETVRKFNELFECIAPGVQVKLHENHADCATFVAR